MIMIPKKIDKWKKQSKGSTRRMKFKKKREKLIKENPSRIILRSQNQEAIIGKR
jgi:hypothetical protein